jgi:formylglycine-generating enzyme required for sulfatase activity
MTTRCMGYLLALVALGSGCGSVSARNPADGGTGGARADATVDLASDGSGAGGSGVGGSGAGGSGVGGSSVDASISDAPVDHVPTCPANMVLIKGGTYTPTGGTSTVFSDYCMDSNEVTAADFAQCVTNSLCTVTGVNVTADVRCFYGKTGMGSYPMNCLATSAAVAYCQANGKHLPSEGEWEWAARGGPLGDIFPWGTDAPDVGGLKLCWNMATAAGACQTRTHPAGNTPSGIYDLAGNVAEVVSTVYSATAQVTKGGSYNDTMAANVQVVARSAFSNSDANPSVGFRCAAAPM